MSGECMCEQCRGVASPPDEPDPVDELEQSRREAAEEDRYDAAMDRLRRSRYDED